MSDEHEQAIKQWEPGRRLGFRWALWGLQMHGRLNEETERAAFEEWRDAE